MPGEGADKNEVRLADHQNASDNTVPTSEIRSAWPRTNAPSLRSMRSQVSRSFFRFGLGKQRRDEVDGPVAFEDPVGRGREHEEDPDEHFEDRQRHLHRRVEELARFGHLAQAFVDRRQQIVLEAFGMRRLLVDLLLRRPTERVLHLVDRARDDEPRGEGEHTADGEVVEQEPDRARNAEPARAFRWRGAVRRRG